MAFASNTIPQPVPSNTSFWQIVKVTLTHPPILCLAIIFACYTSQWITVTGFLPSMYVEHGIDLKVAGVLVSIVVLANLGGTFGAGMLLQRGWKPKTLFSTGFTAMLCSSFLAFAASSWLMFDLQFISAVLFSLIGGIIPTTVLPLLCSMPACQCRSSQCGSGFTAFSLCSIFVPPLSAALVSTTQNWAYIAAVTASLSILGILMTLLLFKHYGQ